MTEREVEKKMQVPAQAVPAPELKRLDALVGEWYAEWHVKSEDAQPDTLYGLDIYEWMQDGFFLAHHTYVRMGSYDYNAMQIIGNYDAENQTYAVQSSDSKGIESSMRARVNDEGVWAFEGNTQCSRLEVSRDGNSMTSYWEQLRDGVHWQPWMDMIFTRVT